MAYFNAITLEIHDLNESMSMSAMKQGLQSSMSTFFLDKKFQKTYFELLMQV